MTRPARLDQLVRRHFGEMLRRLEQMGDLPERKQLAVKLEIANRMLCRIACGGSSGELAGLALDALEQFAEVDEALPLYDGEEQLHS